MKSNYQKTISIFLVIAICFSFLAMPTEAKAFNLFKEIFRGVKKTVNFVTSVPKKATRWMGPVLGPIAADILTYNISKHQKIGKLFKRMSRAKKTIQSIEEQKKLVGEVKTMYKDEATNLRNQADKLFDSRKDLLSKLTKDKDYTYDDYKRDVVALDDLVDVYKEAANRFDRAADRMNTGHVMKMVGKDLIKSVMGELKRAVIFEASQELEKLIDPNIIKTLVEQGNVSADNLLDMLVAGDISQTLNKGDYGDDFDIDALKERVREQIKKILKENKDALKDNWKDMVNDVIQKMIDELKDERENLEEQDEATGDDGEGGYDNPSTDSGEEKKEEKKSSSASEEATEDKGEDGKHVKNPADIPVDEHGCKPGYDFKPNFGISCVQADCNDIPDAHWSYEGYCVCGSSGSMKENPEDPNGECKYKNTYAACPGCVYACIYLDEECSGY
ncbi:hypothetical protein ACFLZ9_01840 [Patescibacteria group bacterium]